MDILDKLDKLPKYFESQETGKLYRLVIIKNDWHGHHRAFIIRYAYEDYSNNCISSTDHIMEVIESTFDRAINKAYEEHKSLKEIKEFQRRR